MGANERLADRIIEHRAYVIRLENGITSRLAKVLSEARRLATDIVSRANEAVSKEEIEVYLARFKASLDGLRGQVEAELADELESLMEAEYRVTYNALKGLLPERYRATLKQGQVVFRDLLSVPVKGITYQQAIENMFRRFEITVEREVRDAWAKAFQAAIERGYGAREAAAVALQETRTLGVKVKAIQQAYRAGMLRDLNMIVHAHTAASLDQAAREVWRQNRHLLRGVQHSATLDAKTCPECAALDGTQYFYDPKPGQKSVEDMPPLPIHPNCRCTRVPILIEEIDPEPPPVRTYKEWQEMQKGKEAVARPAGGEYVRAKRTGTDIDAWLDSSSVKLLGDHPEYCYATIHGEYGDRLAYEIAREQGFDALPKVVTKAELDEAISQGALELYRGVAKEEYAHLFMRGRHFVGTGVHGSGIYTAYGADALRVASGYAVGESPTVIRMALRKEARVVAERDLVKLAEEVKKKVSRLVREALHADNEDLYEKARALRHMTDDLGRLGALLGYDAIDTGSYIVVLNRSAVLVQGEVIKP